MIPATEYVCPRTGLIKKAWHLSSKGYPRFHVKALRNKYVHIVMMEHYLGRKLERDEEVHHRDGNKLDWSRENLKIMGQREHGWYTALQHWYMENIHGHLEKRAWDEYFDDGASEVLPESQGLGEY